MRTGRRDRRWCAGTVPRFGVAAAVTCISLLVNTMAGYAFAKLRFKGRPRLFQLLLGTLVVPGQIGMLPLTGTTNPQHMKEDLQCERFTLSSDELALIETIGL